MPDQERQGELTKEKHWWEDLDQEQAVKTQIELIIREDDLPSAGPGSQRPEMVTKRRLVVWTRVLEYIADNSEYFPEIDLEVLGANISGITGFATLLLTPPQLTMLWKSGIPLDLQRVDEDGPPLELLNINK